MVVRLLFLELFSLLVSPMLKTTVLDMNPDKLSFVWSFKPTSSQLITTVFFLLAGPALIVTRYFAGASVLWYSLSLVGLLFVAIGLFLAASLSTKVEVVYDIPKRLITVKKEQLRVFNFTESTSYSTLLLEKTPMRSWYRWGTFSPLVGELFYCVEGTNLSCEDLCEKIATILSQGNTLPTKVNKSQFPFLETKTC